MTASVNLDVSNLDLLKQFSEDMNSFHGDINAVSGSNMVDAKSLLAILALAKKNFELELISNDPLEEERFKEVAKKYEILEH